jgi:plasmid stabilization system protein ParE
VDRVTFHRLAERELNDAAKYYEIECLGLGSSFLQEADRCLRLIEEHPEAGAAFHGAVRRRILRRFPFALLYKSSLDGVRILAVMNLKRHPTYWVGRE